LLFGGGYIFDAPVICTATSTIYGWLFHATTSGMKRSTAV
jgi:hypothetical protein